MITAQELFNYVYISWIVSLIISIVLILFKNKLEKLEEELIFVACVIEAIVIVGYFVSIYCFLYK